MNYYSPTRFRLMPPVVKNILIINGLMFLATYLFQSKFDLDLTHYLGLYYFKSENFQWYQLISHMFMHGNFMHIFSNMFALWMFGSAIENIWGSKRFAYYYFFTGLGAAALHLLISWFRFYGLEQAIIAYKNSPSPESFAYLIVNYFPEYQLQLNDFISSWSLLRNDPSFVSDSFKFLDYQYLTQINIPTVGASGAVFGLLLAFGMIFPNALIYLYFFVPIKAKYFVILYGFFELYSGIMNQPGDNVAHFAHLGGMLFGLILILFWRKKYRSY
ncbi:MAG: rhomboid family intramembrane serine protease [Bacteroidales bacterium]|nr:rhomboid family intramembrane serine protease [Bacteroidales bacterium]